MTGIYIYTYLCFRRVHAHTPAHTHIHANKFTHTRTYVRTHGRAVFRYFRPRRRGVVVVVFNRRTWPSSGTNARWRNVCVVFFFSPAVDKKYYHWETTAFDGRIDKRPRLGTRTFSREISVQSNAAAVLRAPDSDYWLYTPRARTPTYIYIYTWEVCRITSCIRINTANLSVSRWSMSKSTKWKTRNKRSVKILSAAGRSVLREIIFQQPSRV